MTVENENLNTGLRHIYMHRPVPIYKSRLVERSNAHFEASSAALIASQLAFASPNNILVLGA